MHNNVHTYTHFIDCSRYVVMKSHKEEEHYNYALQAVYSYVCTYLHFMLYVPMYFKFAEIYKIHINIRTFINVKPYPYPVWDGWGYTGDLTFHEIEFSTLELKFAIKSPTCPQFLR